MYFAIEDFMLLEGGDYYGVVTEAWLTQNGFVHNADTECWEIFDFVDADHDDQPDILQELLGINVKETASQDDIGG